LEFEGFCRAFVWGLFSFDGQERWLIVPYKNIEDKREWDRCHREDTIVKRLRRREYERERKNRLRVASYLLLPEPEKSRKLEANAQRRALCLRWRVLV
jgi:hypothetical protein